MNMVLILKSFEDFKEVVDVYGVRAVIIFQKEVYGNQVEYRMQCGKHGCRVVVEKGSKEEKSIDEWLYRINAKEVIGSIPSELFFTGWR